MSTLQLVWDRSRCYDLWSWESEKKHHTASVIQQLHKNVYLARIGPVAGEPTETVVIKIACGVKEQENLEREFDFYMHDLYDLQGQVVPRCEGIYRGRVDGLPFGCLVLQYCSGPPILDGQEFLHQVFIATCKLHEAGVVHGNLLGCRNIIQMGVSPRIIDFSTATRHHCQNGIPTNPYPVLAKGMRSCQELVDLVKTYGLDDLTKLRVSLPMGATNPLWSIYIKKQHNS